ncbi:MAG: prefoldin subunit alpha [Thaumarchaeota archaeon]|nr:prefoldin subunit alpha [Nitrososphaerota archaeon]
MAVSDDEKLQALVGEARVLEAYMGDLNNREALVARAIIETRAVSESLRALGNQDTTEVLFPMGAGIFIRTAPPQADKLIVSVGSNIAMERSKEDTFAFLDARLKELENAGVSIQQEKAELANRLNSARAAINRIVEAQQHRQGPS